MNSIYLSQETNMGEVSVYGLLLFKETLDNFNKSPSIPHHLSHVPVAPGYGVFKSSPYLPNGEFGVK